MPPTESKHYTYLGLEFYAERGLVTIIDTERAADSEVAAHDAIQRISPVDFMQRAIAVRMADPEMYPDETRAFANLWERAMEVFKVAKAQGDPTDPKVLEHFSKHRRRSSILTPGEVTDRVGPVGGIPFKLKQMSPRDIMKKGADVVPDLTIPSHSVLTPQRAEMLRRSRAARRQRR
jgi:hypothetical protein